MSEKEQSIGALWHNPEYDSFSGVIEIDGKKISVIAFKNDYKKEDKHPDYKLFVKRPKGEALPSVAPEETTDIEPF